MWCCPRLLVSKHLDLVGGQMLGPKNLHVDKCGKAKKQWLYISLQKNLAISLSALVLQTPWLCQCATKGLVHCCVGALQGVGQFVRLRSKPGYPSRSTATLFGLREYPRVHLSFYFSQVIFNLSLQLLPVCCFHSQAPKDDKGDTEF